MLNNKLYKNYPKLRFGNTFDFNLRILKTKTIFEMATTLENINRRWKLHWKKSESACSEKIQSVHSYTIATHRSAVMLGDSQTWWSAQ